VNPSDSAPALIALDAKFVLRTPKGERIVDAEDYFIGPDIDITRLHILKPGDLLTAIRIPSTWAGARFYFEKVRDRNVWDFALLNVASAMHVSGNTIESIRLSVNGAAARPDLAERDYACLANVARPHIAGNLGASAVVVAGLWGIESARGVARPSGGRGGTI
jgi:xanthine dehydrogenase YagS FAD-binding subunit